ncbi:hypothetical protein GCM10027294_48410 [Marinactinospora endophytica]
MGNTGKIVLAVAGGYVLGRRKKLKLALGLGLWLGAKKLDIDPRRLLTEVGAELSSLPIVGELRDQARGELLSAGRNAAGAVASRWADGLADSLSRRTDALTGAARAEDDEERGAEDEPADEDRAERAGDDGAERDRPRKKRPSGGERAAKGASTAAKGTSRAAKDGGGRAAKAAGGRSRATRGKSGE